jgi:hypothetical protein
MWPRAKNTTQVRVKLAGVVTALVVLSAYTPSAAADNDLVLAMAI